AIETSHRNAMRLLRLVNNLLDFSRIEAGRVQAQYQLTDLAKYTTELASNFRSVVEAAGLLFQVKADAVIQPVYIDKEMWEKIVLNLLSNAFKYTLKGSITITLITENNLVLLKVADTGVGIPEAKLPKMFQRFHRVQNVVGRTYEGTGIGLSLVSELVKLHGGEIKVQSKEAEGSAFTVSIPTGKAHLPTQHVFEKELDFTASLSDAFINEATTLIDHSVLTGNGTEVLKVHTDAATVLVVDDNADMRAYIKSLLQKQYHVVTANNGMDALHQIKEHAPQLILSDVMMPVMDGIGLLKAVKENVQTQNIPVILLSARAGEESKIEGYETGADDYLVKPFSAKELLARVAANINLAKLRQVSEANVRNLFMQAPAAIAVHRGPKHIYELANATYLQLIGNRDLVGKPVREALPELDGVGIFELLDEVYKTGKPYIGNELQATIQRANGKLEEGFFNFVYQASRNEQGEIDGILVHAIEVTEQIIARKRIEESESRFRTLTQSLPQLIWTANPDGYCDFFNQNWYDYTGSTPEQSFGDGWAQYLHHQHAQPLFAVWQQCLQTGEPIIFEFQCRAKDGHYEWFYVSGQALRDEVGAVSKWIGTLTNIDERKKAEAVLQESETRFRTLADLVPQIIWTSKPDGFLDYYNKRWYDYTGFQEGFGDQSWIPILHPDDVEFCIATWHASVKTGKPYHIEYRFKERTTGIYRWFLGKALPIRDTSGTITKWFGTCTDIHDQKTITENLEKLVAERTKDLERSNEDLQQFAHVASHDLKEPLRKIMTFSNRLKDECEGDLPEKAKNYIAKIEGASKRMNSMIDGVLLYSSVGSGEPAVEKSDLNETLRYVETDLEMVIQQKQAVIYKEDLPIIEGSPVLLHQLFYNLVNNALKFSKADIKPLIQIVSEKVKGQNIPNDGLPNQEYLQISVKDNGIGFDQSQADKIFQTFSRLNSKDKYEGTGLGLALCKKIAERHGGTMRAEGKEGEGATFTIVLPVKKS
ncbi:MAG: ATP-binding protein, partial [Chitinophagaceae bacterium]